MLKGLDMSRRAILRGKVNSLWRRQCVISSRFFIWKYPENFLELPGVPWFLCRHVRKDPCIHLGRAASDAGRLVSSLGPRPVPQIKTKYVSLPGMVFGRWQGPFNISFSLIWLGLYMSLITLLGTFDDQLPKRSAVSICPTLTLLWGLFACDLIKIHNKLGTLPHSAVRTWRCWV